MSMLDRYNENKAERDAEKYMRRYPKEMQLLENFSPLSKVRSITEYDIYALGMQLDAFNTYHRMCEDDGSVAALGTIPNIAMDVIAATYGTSPLSVIASVQPLEEERGVVYYKQVLAQTTRGGVTSGQTIFDSTSMPQAYLQNYSSSFNTNILLGTTTTATTQAFTVASGYLPIRPGQFSVTYALSASPLTATDDGNGNLLGQGMWGSVNYTTGAISLLFATAPTNGTQIQANFTTLFEQAASIPQINLNLASKPVTAYPFVLRNTVGLEQSYAMKKRFGMIANDEMTKDLVAAINSEIVNTLVINLLASVSAANTLTFNYTPNSGVSILENKQHLKDVISTAQATIITSANRGTINVIVAGAGAVSVMATLPGWVRLSDGTNMGPHIVGTLDGIVIVQVPNPNVLSSYTMICMYKGTAPYDAACVYAPYMPLMVTTALPTGVNPLQQQKAAVVWAAVEVLLTNFIAVINITGAPTVGGAT